MRATLESVARLAGVSKSTASRVLTGDPRVLPETQRRVHEAAATLRYHPNRMASALRTRRTGLVGLVVNTLNNATFTRIAETLQSGAALSGLQVLVCSTEGDPQREAAFLDTAVEHHLDGVVVAGTGENVERINALLEYGTAVVTMNREVPGSRAPSVMPDYRTAARLATEHLLALGHTRIATVAGLDRFTSGREHHLGFVSAMADAGLAARPGLTLRGPFTADFGRQAARQLLDPGNRADRPTALLVSNHEATYGVLPALTEAGVAIPEEISMICTEDAPWFAWWHPRLTVVDNRAVTMAERALDLLRRQLAEEVLEPVPAELVEPVIVTRESTGPARAR